MIVKQLSQKTYRTIITLEEYARFIGYSECAIFGVYNPANHVEDACRDIWTLAQRNYLLHYFAEAQEEIENEVKFLFQPTWITGNLADTGNWRLTDIQTCKPSYYTKWNNLIQMGRKTEHIIGEDVAITHDSDPVEIDITINPTIVQSLHFINIFYPGTNIEINPSDMTITGTTLHIEIPRCRLVAYALRDNDSSGVLYTDDDNFQDTIDIKYYYTTDLNSIVEFGDGSAGLYYLAGEILPTEQQFDMVMRLAHSKMPDEPCGCEIAQSLWKRDRNIPDYLTTERLNNPFGVNDGAMVVHQWVKSIKKLRVGHG